MKINKKNNIHIELNESNLQNKQRKDYLKNLNSNVQNKGFFLRKIFKDLVIANVINKSFQRSFSMNNNDNSDEDKNIISNNQIEITNFDDNVSATITYSLLNFIQNNCYIL